MGWKTPIAAAMLLCLFGTIASAQALYKRAHIPTWRE
jgi:hypothetical protein